MSCRSRPTSRAIDAAGAEVEPLDLDQRRIGIGDIPADDRVAAGLQRTGQIEPHRLGDLDEILALGHALHAVDAKPGDVVPALGDQRVAVRRLDVAVGRQRLLEQQREAREAYWPGSRSWGGSRRLGGNDRAPAIDDPGENIARALEEAAGGQHPNAGEKVVTPRVGRTGKAQKPVRQPTRAGSA